jgi:cellulose synthase/poly-beta-1,6-N-acetylglucosamine synthase-like glycosyltransferase
MELAFWVAVAFITYAYFGYPLMLGLVALLRRRAIAKGDVAPTVSFIITAHNEEKRIREKIENALGQAYPTRDLEIIVASDCSTDETDELVRSFESRGVRLVRAPARRGKEHAQKLAIATARGEILVFSDVGTILPSDGIRRIVRNFADPTVGCVSSVDRLMDREGRVSGEGAYVRYEMLLRRLETRASSVVGLSGSFFAARRQVCREWSTELPSDFRTLFDAVRMGYRGVSDEDSIGYYRAIVDESREFERKIRTVLRGIAAVMANRDMLNPLRYGIFAWQLWSHKICRWLVPFFMILALISNGMLIGRPRYLALFIIQMGLYAMACCGMWTSRFMGSRMLTIPAFLVLANLSIVSAWYRYASGQRVVSWTPSER